ncbi:MAG: type II secretion system inner membrane protein GspF [Gammaproteobacteria bacterium]|nr:type II secretion system inner membrane protein GspF [Gammaproteobacteria bacterium]
MPAFEYIALNAEGRQQHGVLEGDSARTVRFLLRERNLTPISVNETRKNNKADTARSGSGLFNRQSMSTAELALITRQLATLCRSGTPLEEALGVIARQTEKNRSKSVLLSVRARILEGHSFANALNDYPGIFPDLYRSSIMAGEQSGHLDTVLERLAEYTEARLALVQDIGVKLMYPVLICLVAIGVIIFLVAGVVPQIVEVFEQQDMDLPIMTQILLFSSSVLRNYWWLGVILLFVGSMTIYSLLKVEANRRKWHHLLLRLPFIGKLIRGLNAARFARTLSMLSSSGVPILQSLQIAASTIRNLPMREAIEQTAVKVREGGSIARALDKTNLFPPMTMHMIASGEASGQLEQLLAKAADYQERETKSMVNIFVGLFEPLMILSMGLVVLFIVLAVLLPILDMNSLVQ